MIVRRIVTQLSPASIPVAAKDPRLCCTRTIKLDGKLYRCRREVRIFDKQHDGIHDAFAVHGDGGQVRW